MTRKQFFKKYYWLDQPKDKAPYIAVIKKYRGYLSWFRLSLLIYVAIGFGRRGAESIISYVEAVIDSEIKGKSSSKR